MDGIEKMKVRSLNERYEVVSECGVTSTDEKDMQLGLEDLTLFLAAIAFTYMCVVSWIYLKGQRVKMKEAKGEKSTFGRVANLMAAADAFDDPIGRGSGRGVIVPCSDDQVVEVDTKSAADKPSLTHLMTKAAAAKQDQHTS
jgi:hypothetical protein